MAFQDFDQISERRRVERARQFRNRVIIGVVSVSLILLMALAVVFVQVSPSSKSTSTNNSRSSKQGETSDMKQVSRLEKMITMMCNSTNYKGKCERTLKEAAVHVKDSEPKDLIKVAISATLAEVKSAVKKVSALKFATPMEKGAFEDCKGLLEDAVEELEMCERELETAVTKKVTENVNNWLSAVMSYHETCVDGFLDQAGKLKMEMEEALKAGKELTSNSLAMMSQVANSSEMPTVTSRRHLMVKRDRLPTWMSRNERRMLKDKPKPKPKPNVVVAKDGSGDFKTINQALAAMPSKYDGRYVIYIKEGIYEETVVITKNMVSVTMYGDGSQKSMISGSKNFGDGVSTFQTATFVAIGDRFLGQGIGFRNTAGPEKLQAVAARVQADRAIFVNCRFEGYQDTLYTQTHRQFYRSCLVIGTIDFIFGDAAVIFQNCNIMLKKPLPGQQNTITSQGRVDKHETTGIVLQKCNIVGGKSLEPVKAQFKSYLGRPWKEFSRTVVMESAIEDVIDPEGWMPWKGDFALQTLYYAEFNNQGPGANTHARVKWPGYRLIDKQQAAKFTVGTFLDQDWIQSSSVPVHVGLF